MPQRRSFVNGNDLADVYLFSEPIVRELHGVGAVRTATLSFSSDPCHRNATDECQSNPTDTIVFSDSNRSHRGLSLLFSSLWMVEEEQRRDIRLHSFGDRLDLIVPALSAVSLEYSLDIAFWKKRNSNCLYRKQD